MQDCETDESFTMEGLLATCPDQRCANLLLRGIKKGRLELALVYKSIQLKSHYQNLLSATNHAQVVQAYLDKKLEEEQVIIANH